MAARSVIEDLTIMAGEIIPAIQAGKFNYQYTVMVTKVNWLVALAPTSHVIPALTPTSHVIPAYSSSNTATGSSEASGLPPLVVHTGPTRSPVSSMVSPFLLNVFS